MKLIRICINEGKHNLISTPNYTCSFVCSAKPCNNTSNDFFVCLCVVMPQSLQLLSQAVDHFFSLFFFIPLPAVCFTLTCPFPLCRCNSLMSKLHSTNQCNPGDSPGDVSFLCFFIFLLYNTKKKQVACTLLTLKSKESSETSGWEGNDAQTFVPRQFIFIHRSWRGRRGEVNAAANGQFTRAAEFGQTCESGK